MKPVIEIRDISERYELGQHAQMYSNFRELLAGTFRKLGKAERPISRNVCGLSDSNSFSTVKNVSIDIQAGETVAIIGSNGAGKGTLPKIVSCIPIQPLATLKFADEWAVCWKWVLDFIPVGGGAS
jgi:ABC-type polysaccharide/polyol phosphate transport system ATPase subunit